MSEMNEASDRFPYDVPDNQRFSLAAFAKMNAFRKRSQLCDVVVKVGEREFPAHRVVLAASSDYFDAMFSSGMAESAQLEVELKSVSPDVMEALLDFVYTGQVQVSMDNVQDLLPAASLVQMEGVKAVCSAFLFGEVDASNVLGIRRFAELHSCNELEAFAKNFAAHNFETVIDHEEFLFLSVDELSELLSREDLHVDCEETVYRAMIRWVYRDTNERSASLPILLNHLRLAIMSVRFLTDVVDTEPLIRMSMECRDLVDAAKRFHLRPDLRYQMRNQRFRQRDGGDEYLVVIGGFGSYQSPSDSVEMFNPRTREWSELPNLPISYRYVAACSLGTCVYVIGGFDGGERLSTVGLLDVAQREDGWRWLAPMHYKRGLSAACTHKGLIYVCGGFDGQTRLRALEVYHPKIDEWRILEEMNTAREGAGLVVADDCLYCLGGYDGFQLLNSMESFDLRGGTWSICKSMYMRRSGAGCAVLGDTIYVCGGYGGAEGRGPLHLDTVESYNTRFSQWTLVCSMNVPRCYVGACQLAGLIYVAAGYNGNRLLNTVEAFDPVENCWTLYEENRMHNERCDTGMCVVRSLSYADSNNITNAHHPSSSFFRFGETVLPNSMPNRSRLEAGSSSRSILNVRSAPIAHDSLGRSSFFIDSGVPSVGARNLPVNRDGVIGRLRSGLHQPSAPIQAFEQPSDSSSCVPYVSHFSQLPGSRASGPLSTGCYINSTPHTTSSSSANRISISNTSISSFSNCIVDQPPGSVSTFCDARSSRVIETSFPRVSHNGAPIQTAFPNGDPQLPFHYIESLPLESFEEPYDLTNSFTSRIMEDLEQRAGVSYNFLEGDEGANASSNKLSSQPSADYIREDPEFLSDGVEPLLETSFPALQSLQLSHLSVNSSENIQQNKGLTSLFGTIKPHIRHISDFVGQEIAELNSCPVSITDSNSEDLALAENRCSPVPIYTKSSFESTFTACVSDSLFQHIFNEDSNIESGFSEPSHFLTNEHGIVSLDEDFGQLQNEFSNSLSAADICLRQSGSNFPTVLPNASNDEEEDKINKVSEFPPNLENIQINVESESSRLAYLNLEESGVPSDDVNNISDFRQLSDLDIRERTSPGVCLQSRSLSLASLPGRPSPINLLPSDTSSFSVSSAISPNDFRRTVAISEGSSSQSIQFFPACSIVISDNIDSEGLPVGKLINHHPQPNSIIHRSSSELFFVSPPPPQSLHDCNPQLPLSAEDWSYRYHRTSSTNQTTFASADGDDSLGSSDCNNSLLSTPNQTPNHRASFLADERPVCICCTAHAIASEVYMPLSEEEAMSASYQAPDDQPDFRSDGEGEEGDNPVPSSIRNRQSQNSSPSTLGEIFPSSTPVSRFGW